MEPVSLKAEFKTQVSSAVKKAKAKNKEFAKVTFALPSALSEFYFEEVIRESIAQGLTPVLSVIGQTSAVVIFYWKARTLIIPFPKTKAENDMLISLGLPAERKETQGHDKLIEFSNYEGDLTHMKYVLFMQYYYHRVHLSKT